MPLNLNKFRQAEYTPRTEAVPVPDLGYLFDDGEEPVWEVRGLAAAELQGVLDAANNKDLTQVLLTALMDVSVPKEERAERVREAMGMPVGDVPLETKKKMELLVLGSVSLDISLADAAMLQERHPIEFLTLTTKITELTGKGQVPPGELKPSGETNP